MNKQGCLFLVLLTSLLSGCLSSVWTGANIIYGRHTLYKKINDYELTLRAQHILFHDKKLKQPGCVLDLAAFNGDILIAGHVPTASLRDLVFQRLSRLTGYRELFKQVAILNETHSSLQDTWVTTRICAQIIADSTIDPSQFKILTADNIVYIMGDVKPDQAERVLQIASKTEGVKRVVKLLRYYNLTK